MPSKWNSFWCYICNVCGGELVLLEMFRIIEISMPDMCISMRHFICQKKINQVAYYLIWKCNGKMISELFNDHSSIYILFLCSSDSSHLSILCPFITIFLPLYCQKFILCQAFNCSHIPVYLHQRVLWTQNFELVQLEDWKSVWKDSQYQA